MPTTNEQDRIIGYKIVAEGVVYMPSGGVYAPSCLEKACNILAAYREEIIASEREAAAERAIAWISSGLIQPSQEQRCSLRAAILDGQSARPGVRKVNEYQYLLTAYEYRALMTAAARSISATPLQEARDRGEALRECISDWGCQHDHPDILQEIDDRMRRTDDAVRAASCTKA
jgi:hypothetical protein